MSAISERSSGSIVVADFANTDASGKLNILGAGVAIIAVMPQSGLTARFTVVGTIQVPADLLPAEFTAELTLADASGEPVAAPGPAGPQILRFAQIMTLSPMGGPVAEHVRQHVGATGQMSLDFAGGLPLSAGGDYYWQLRIDGDDDHKWSYPISVAGPPPGMVVG